MTIGIKYVEDKIHCWERLDASTENFFGGRNENKRSQTYDPST